MTEEQLQKLPKYAQLEIRKLRRDVKYYSNIIHSEESEKTRIHVDHDGNRKYIAGERIYVDNEVLIRLDHDCTLTIIYVGDREMTFKPHSSNSFKVLVKKRWKR